jgi:WD40 repeat protein
VGTWMLYSLLRLQHTNAGGRGLAPDGGGPQHEVMCVGLASAGGGRAAPLLVSGAQDGSVCVWHPSTGAWLDTIRAHDGWVMALALGRRRDEAGGDETLLLTGSFDKTLKVWAKRADPAAAAAAPPAAAAPNGPSGLGGTGRAGSPSPQGGGQWALEHTLEHESGVLAVELSRQRRLCYAGGDDGTVSVWALLRGERLFVLRGHTKGVCAIGQHLASGCLATGSEDGAVRLWDTAALTDPDEPPAETPRCVNALELKHDDGTDAEVLSIVPSADGTALFCGLDDGCIALLGDAPGPLA